MIEAVRAVVTAERTLGFEAFALSDSLTDGEVLVQMERTIVSAGTELANYTGLEPDTRRPGSWCYYPWRPGYGGVGSVLAVGRGVRGRTPGSRVYGIFNHASHALVDSERELCVPVPEGLDSTTAVFARMGNVSITALQRSTVALGDNVVVVGLGIVGNLAGQFFVRAGALVTGVDLSARRREIALASGFHAITGRLDGLEAERPRIVVDAVGDSRVIEAAVEAVAVNGQVILLGTARVPYETDATRVLRQAHQKGVSIIGALEWNIPLLQRRTGNGLSTEGNGALILAMLARSELNVAALATHVLSPGELARGYEGLLSDKERYLGVVLDWENGPLPAVTSP